MFLARRPSRDAISRFLRGSHDLPLSYGPIGIVRDGAARKGLDEETVAIGRGSADFARARAALMAWKQFDIGWVETFPPACAGRDRNRRGGSHPPPRVLVIERLPRPVQRRLAG